MLFLALALVLGVRRRAGLLVLMMILQLLALALAIGVGRRAGLIVLMMILHL